MDHLIQSSQLIGCRNWYLIKKLLDDTDMS